MTVVGIWASGVVERKLARKDPQIVCIDEVAGVFVTWLAAPPTWVGLLVGVALFRMFDQFKPWPARLAERRLAAAPASWATTSSPGSGAAPCSSPPVISACFEIGNPRKGSHPLPHRVGRDM